jgi:hypothetical protein
MARTVDDKVASFRKRAEELRTTADGMKDESARASLLGLALSYDDMCRQAEFLLVPSAALRLTTQHQIKFKAACMRQANECDALAEIGTTPDERKAILAIAVALRQLVTDREKLSEI